MTKIFFLLFLLVSCTNESQQHISYPETESKALNNFVRSAPLQYINLDEVPVVNIRLTSDNMIYESNAVDSEGYVLQLKSTLIEKEKLYAFDGIQDEIIKLNLNGEVEETVARKGRGPGEVLNVYQIEKNDSTIFVIDASNARINMYDLKFTPIGSIEGINAMSIAVNNTYLAYRKISDYGMPTSGLITIVRIHSPKDSVSKILPKIIPDGFQPVIFNSTNFDMNNKNEIAASYTYLPWLSIFDSTFSLERTLIFESSDFANRNFLPLVVKSGSSSSALGYESVIKNFNYSDQGDLFISDPLGVIYLKRKPDRSFEAIRIYNIEYPESHERFLLNNWEIFEDGTLMGTGWNHWFQVNLKDFD